MKKLVIEIVDDEVTVLDALVVAELKRSRDAAASGGPDGDPEYHHRLMRGFAVILEHYGEPIEQQIYPIKVVE